VLDGVIDELIEGRFTAGFLTGQSRLVPARGGPSRFTKWRPRGGTSRVFRRWLDRKPARRDLHPLPRGEALAWTLGLRVPADIGLIQYEWRADHAEWAGMDQRNDLVGEAAVDMLHLHGPPQRTWRARNPARR
jgi:LacI family transcriptional regulator